MLELATILAFVANTILLRTNIKKGNTLPAFLHWLGATAAGSACIALFIYG